MKRAWVVEVGNLHKNEVKITAALSLTSAQSFFENQKATVLAELIEAGEYQPELYKVNDSFYRFGDYIYISLEEIGVI